MAQSSGSPTSGDVEEQLGVIRKEIKALADIVGEMAKDRAEGGAGAAREEFDRLRRETERVAGDAAERVRRARGSVESQIAEHPVQSAVAALLVGFVIGAMVRR